MISRPLWRGPRCQAWTWTITLQPAPLPGQGSQVRALTGTGPPVACPASSAPPFALKSGQGTGGLTTLPTFVPGLAQLVEVRVERPLGSRLPLLCV